MEADILLLMVALGCDAGQARVEYARLEKFLIVRDTGMRTAVRQEVVQCATLNVRARPSTATPIIGQVKLGTEVAVWGQTPIGDWLCIAEPAGWVHTATLRAPAL